MDRLKELADKLYSSAQYLSTDASRLRKAMKDYHDFVTYEYPKVKKDLALTWEDMVKVVEIVGDLGNHSDLALRGGTTGGIQPFYEEVLRRFNEQKKK